MIETLYTLYSEELSNLNHVKKFALKMRVSIDKEKNGASSRR
jgi:hypothetical protein